MSMIQRTRAASNGTGPVAGPIARVLPPLQEREQLYFALRAVAVLNLVCLALMWRGRALIDYSAFYSAGRLALSSPGLVYSAAAQKAEELRIFPGASGWIAFYHPPFELLAFAPLARLPYAISLAVWTTISAVFLFISTKLLSSVTGIHWRQLAILAFALFPSCSVFYLGQDSFLLLLVLSAVLFLATRRQDELAGIVLAVGLFKPQIPLVIAAALFLQGRRKLSAWFCASAGSIGLASLAYIGRSGLRQLLSMIRIQEPMDDTWRMPTIRGLLSLVHAPKSLILVLSLALLSVFLVRWHRSEPRLLPAFSSAILVGSLIAFHFHGYDLCLLLIPMAYFLVTEESPIQLTAFLLIAASPVFFLLLAMKASAFLAIPVLVLALHPALSVPKYSEPHEKLA